MATLTLPGSCGSLPVEPASESPDPMARFTLIKENTNIDFVGKRLIAFVFSILLLVVGGIAVALKGLDFGIDFTGGVMIEVQAKKAFDVAAMREKLAGLNLGEVQLQNFGGPNGLLVRVQPIGRAVDRDAAAVLRVKEALGPTLDYRRVEAVGPAISAELLRDGILATVLAVLAIAIYVWFRFEWQFGLLALVTTGYDVLATLGLFAVFDLEFNIAAVAALLTVAGYSINDTVVVFDRIRENLRKFRRDPLPRIINRSVNETLSRTIRTSSTTLLAVFALLMFGGDVILNFNAAVLCGVLIGTFSSIYVAAALLLYLPAPKALRPAAEPREGETPPKAAG